MQNSFHEAVNEDWLHSISARDFDKVEKQNTRNSFNKKVLEHEPKFPTMRILLILRIMASIMLP